MPRKDEGLGQAVVKDEVEGDSVCCPVCSVFLPKEVSLHDHLDSHPKLQVIEALIQLKDACKIGSSLEKSSSSGGLANVEISCESRDSVDETEQNNHITKPIPHSQAPVKFGPSLGSAGSVSSPDPISIVQTLTSSRVPLISIFRIAHGPAEDRITNSPAQLLGLSSCHSPDCSDDDDDEFGNVESPINLVARDQKNWSSLSAKCVASPLRVEETEDDEVGNKSEESSAPLEQEPESILPLQIEIVEEDEPNAQEGRVTALDRELLSPPKKRRCSDWNSLGSPGSHSSCGVEGGLRVRSDLSISPCAGSPSPSSAEEKINMWQIGAKMNSKINVQKSLSCSNAIDYCKPKGNDSMPPDYCKEISSFSQSLKMVHESTSNKLACSDSPQIYDKTETNQDSLEGECHNSETSSLERQRQDDNSTDRPCSPLCESGPESFDSPATPLNIQTDETMPPRGELSEQESIGGNSSSLWSVPAYHASRELSSPVVSYDLTARESWPGSDISDTEGNANAPPDCDQPQRFTSASFSNTLNPFSQSSASDDNLVGDSPFSSIQPQAPSESKFSSTNPSCKTVNNKAVNSKSTSKTSTKRERKTPAKPRVYRCKACLVEFRTITLRRLHPCEQMNAMPLTSDVKKDSEENISVAGSSSRDGESKPKRKYTRKPKATVKKEVIVDDQSSGQANFGEEFYSKTVSENTESRINSQLSSEVPSSGSYQNSSYNASAPDISFVEVTLKPELTIPSFGTFQCLKCGQVCPTEKSLSQHNVSKHTGQKYLCAICGETFFEKEREYFNHLMVHPLECQTCGKSFKRRKSLSLHIKRHMEVKPYKCNSCSKSFVTKQKLDEHVNTHTGSAPIKCTFCEETFKRYSNLIQHRNRHHLNIARKVKDFICHCGEVYHSKKKLNWHKEIHDDKPKSCHYCSEKFVHTVSLTRHVRRAHDRRYVPKKERETENIECPVCHLVFLKSSLAAHVKLHSGERPHSCHICGKDFTTKWNLQLHRWTHASRSSKPFRCTLCKSAFFRKQDYSLHMHSHRNMRRFTCNHCGCQFLRRYNCIRHMREHEEGKNFTCTVCNKTFHRSYYLKDHMRVHSGARPFSCHICGKASTSKSNHNKHVRIHHAREPQNTEV